MNVTLRAPVDDEMMLLKNIFSLCCNLPKVSEF